MLALILALAMQTGALPMTTIDHGNQSNIDDAKQVVVRTAQEWTTLWRRHNPDRQRPSVDFARDMVVGVFLGSRPTAGYDIEIVSVKDGADATVVRYRVKQPARDAMTAQVLTSPYQLVVVPKRAGQVTFEEAKP